MRRFKKIRLSFSLIRTPSHAVDANEVQSVNWRGTIILNNEIQITVSFVISFPVFRKVTCVNRSLKICNH